MVADFWLSADYCNYSHSQPALSSHWTLEDNWFIRNDCRMLWVPPDFRTGRSTSWNNLFAMGYTLDRVLFLKFDGSSEEFWWQWYVCTCCKYSDGNCGHNQNLEDYYFCEMSPPIVVSFLSYFYMYCHSLFLFFLLKGSASQSTSQPARERERHPTYNTVKRRERYYDLWNSYIVRPLSIFMYVFDSHFHVIGSIKYGV